MINSYDDVEVFNNYLDTRKDSNSKHNKTLKDNLKDLIGNVENKTILDLGCGIGEFSRYFAENGAKKVVGIDISKSFLNMQRKTIIRKI